MESKENETGQKNSSFSKTQSYLNKTIHSKNDSKSKKGGIKLPKIFSTMQKPSHKCLEMN